jgi:hypothetical protein
LEGKVESLESRIEQLEALSKFPKWKYIPLI